MIDSDHAGRDSGQVLGHLANRIPVHDGLAMALGRGIPVPDTFIYGMAPANGRLSPKDRAVVLAAIAHGMNIVSGLHEYLGDDAEISAAAQSHGVSIRDVRRPRPVKDMRLFDGSVANVTALRIAVLGTDCAIGKRTTATVLAGILNAHDIRTVVVGTGQTGLMQGASYGIALDAVPPQYCCGELERAIVAASVNERPDVILIEGQGALSHPAFCTSAFILRGSQPHAVILQHAPRRPHRCDFPKMPMPEPRDEIALIETFSDTRVIGLTINHEHMTDGDISSAILAYQSELGIPVTDALSRPAIELAEMVLSAFPNLRAAPAMAMV
ncbi:MAG: DUF1611 domain-containing protein [Minwuia sp.]|nr:DUF1611 domain-containing protein [Minwuia sp.]